jgi:hypothetical protein
MPPDGKLNPGHNILVDVPDSISAEFETKTMEEIFVALADTKKPDIAASLLAAVLTNDPSAIKIMQNIMDRQGGGIEKVIPISNEQFKTIIRIAASELLN